MSFLDQPTGTPGGDLTLGFTRSDFYTFFFPNNVSSHGLAASIAVKFGEGLLYGFTVLNTNAAAQFIQLFDRPTAPANGAVPDVVFSAAASSHLPISWAPTARTFRSGCFLANSSTAATLTAGAADCFWDVQVL